MMVIDDDFIVISRSCSSFLQSMYLIGLRVWQALSFPHTVVCQQDAAK